MTAWQDLALHLIARLCGPGHAARTAKVYLLAGHEDGQLPFSTMTRRVRTGDSVIRDGLAWIADNYAAPNPVTAMTERSGLSSRTFARRFQAATGHRSIDYVHTAGMTFRVHPRPGIVRGSQLRYGRACPWRNNGRRAPFHSPRQDADAGSRDRAR